MPARVDFEIESIGAGDGRAVPVGSPSSPIAANSAQPHVAADPKRVAAFVKEHHGFVWRVLRRFGLAPTDADDAAQKVFLIAVTRLADIAPGSEKAFLFRTAVHTASKAQRALRRRIDRPAPGSLEAQSSLPLADALLDERRARDLLDRILAELPKELHGVFVLFEIEGLTAPQVAEALEIPVGTVASRLRRARSEVSARLLRHQTRSVFKGRLR